MLRRFLLSFEKYKRPDCLNAAKIIETNHGWHAAVILQVLFIKTVP